MSSEIQPQRRAKRSSRPDTQRWLTVMVVLSHRTFRWSLTRRTLIWILGGILGFWVLGVVGSGYGWWATKKILSFSQLQRETQAQQEQIKSTLGQAKALDDEIATLRQQHTELMKLLDPKAGGPNLPVLPSKGAEAPAPDASAKERMTKLKEALDLSSVQAKAIQARMDPILKAWTRTPAVPPTAGFISSSFGVRVSPFGKVNEEGEGLLAFHSGLDITNAPNTPIQATADGVVEEAGWMDRYGNAVVLRHGPDMETLYGHMSVIQVHKGQQIARGDILGLMGQTGNATGVHLHYEVRRAGKPVNPQPYLRLQKQWLGTFK